MLEEATALLETKELHGLAAGAMPERADWTIDQGWDRYTPAEHAVWKTLFERQSKLLPGRACDEFVDGMNKLPIGPDQIPDFRRLSEVLMRKTGWQVVAVPGLVLGLGYIFFFNSPSNPISGLYQTMTLLVLCTIVHFYTTGHLTAVTALKALDAELLGIAGN